MHITVLKNMKIIKFSLLGIGFVLIIYIGFSIISLFVPKEPETTEYYPFKSAEAKTQYISYYDTLAKSLYPDSKTIYIETSFGKTFVRIIGQETLPPLVLLHGLESNSLMWSIDIKVLSKKYKVIAVDNVNDYTRSISTRIIESSNNYTDWLDELFTKLDLKENINLLGMSNGGWLAGQYLIRFPHRLNKAILIAPGGTILPSQFQFYLRGIVMTLIPTRYFREHFFSWLLNDLAKTNKILFNKIIDNQMINLKYFERASKVRTTLLTDEELRSIEQPVLILFGENEKNYSPYEAVRRLDRVAPSIKKEIIPNAGHDLISVQPDLVTKKILEFLNQK